MIADATRCSSCVLPATTRFALDAHGTCALCNAANRVAAPQCSAPNLERELEERLRTIRELGRGRPFDCVVGLSGGRDSTYLLSLLVRKHGLRCLAAYYRTPFTPSVTDANVRRTVARLEVPLAEIALSRERHQRFARELVLLWTHQPDAIIANVMCAPCKLVNREFFEIARANGVRTVVAGGNAFEVVQFAASVPSGSAVTTRALLTGRKQLQVSAMLARRGAVALARHPGLLKHLKLGIQAALMYVNPHTPYLRLRHRDIRALEYFYYAPWREADCERAIAELGWELPPGCRSTWRSDCAFAEIKNQIFKQTTGVTYFEAYLSNLVRAGQLDRAEALRRVAIGEGRPSEERLRWVCDILELPRDLFARASRAAPIRATQAEPCHAPR